MWSLAAVIVLASYTQASEVALPNPNPSANPGVVWIHGLMTYGQKDAEGRLAKIGSAAINDFTFIYGSQPRSISLTPGTSSTPTEPFLKGPEEVNPSLNNIDGPKPVRITIMGQKPVQFQYPKSTPGLLSLNKPQYLDQAPFHRMKRQAGEESESEESSESGESEESDESDEST